jgi:hypothetical protein
MVLWREGQTWCGHLHCQLRMRCMVQERNAAVFSGIHGAVSVSCRAHQRTATLPGFAGLAGLPNVTCSKPQVTTRLTMNACVAPANLLAFARRRAIRGVQVQVRTRSMPPQFIHPILTPALHRRRYKSCHDQRARAWARQTF